MQKSSPQSAPLASGRPPIAILVVIAAVAALPMNIFLPSMPAMALHFDTSYALIQLAVPLYFAMNAGLQIIVGPLSDRYGRRPILLYSIIGYLIATLGCIYAPTLEVFLFFRLCQAIIVSCLVLSRAIVRDLFPPDQAASAIGYVTMGMAVVPMLAPALGGVLDEAYGWQANFWIMIITGLFCLVLVYTRLAETSQQTFSSMRQQFAAYPELFTSRRFWGYSLTAGFSSGAFFAFIGGAAFVGIEIFNLSPTAIGIYLGAPSVGYFFGNWLSGRHSTRLGINRMMLIGVLITSAGMLACVLTQLTGTTHPVAFFGFVVFVGFGNGMTLPSTTSGMVSVRPNLAGSASGIGGAVMLGLGAVLSGFSGALLSDETGLWPVLLIMFGSSVASVLTVVYVIRIARQAGDLKI
jgi:DHA1 family bicyclomycin/chloramphenicol resistance-like MFS transporter